MTRKTVSPMNHASRNPHLPAMGRALSMIASRPLAESSAEVNFIAAETSAPAEAVRACKAKKALVAL